VNGNGSAQSPSRSQTGGLLIACVVLTLVVLLALPVFAWVGHWRSGTAGILAAAVAAGLCWCGAMLALLLAGWLRNGQQAVNGVLAGMLFRMGVPLVAGLALHMQGGSLAEAGVFGMTLAFYFVTLIAETLLALRLVAPSGKRTNVTEAS
jgi:hypothetical protein